MVSAYPAPPGRGASIKGDLAMERTRLLDVTNVSARYPGSKKVILRDVDLTLYSGQITCVIGESGCVQGNIKTGNLTLDGMVTGNVDCDGTLSIQAKGAIVGDIRVRSLNIVNGGVFKGRRETSHV